MFPHRLTDKSAFDIAQALVDGFNRHYRLFRETTAQAKQRFEQADWAGQQSAQALRIEFYDRRVDEAVLRLRTEYNIDALSMDTWQQAKLHYIGLQLQTEAAAVARLIQWAVVDRAAGMA